MIVVRKKKWVKSNSVIDQFNIMYMDDITSNN